MHRFKITSYLLLLILFGIYSCKKDEPVEPDTGRPFINNFGFLAENNPELKSNIYLTNINGKLLGRLPLDADIKDMTASFDSYGSEVRIGEQLQISGETSNDFTEILNYKVSKNGDTKTFEVDATWFTGLPIIDINTVNHQEIISKDEYIEGNATIKGNRGFEDAEGELTIRGRGHSTWFLHPKKPYQLKFNDKTAILGMPKAKKWIFLAEYSDKSLIRNRLGFEMGYISNLDWTPKCQYAEVFINDDYAGTYNVCEKVEEGSNRLNIGEDGYLLEIDTPDHLNEDDIYFYSDNFLFQIKEPQIDYASPKFDLIVDHILEFENVLFGPNFKDPASGYRSYIDIESFIDWFLINEIAKNVDAMSYSSIYLNYKPGEKIKMGPLWDFDLAFGNVDYADSQYPDGFWVKYNNYFDRMFQDPYFVNQVKSRFKYFKSQESYFMDIIEEQKYALRYAQDENNQRWDLFGNYVWPNPVYFETHIEEVDHLKEWLNERLNWLDNAFESM